MEASNNHECPLIHSLRLVVGLGQGQGLKERVRVMVGDTKCL